MHNRTPSPRTTTSQASGGVHASGKAPTGISGFDEITGGGLPRGRTTLLLGGPGSVEQSKSVTARDRRSPSEGQPESDTFTHAVCEAISSLRSQAKQMCHFAASSRRTLRKLLLGKGFLR